jgi:hypothetical protein
MSNSSLRISVDSSEPGRILGNKNSDINVWGAATIVESIKPSALADIRHFTETIQITQATGGNPDRDLFIDPHDRSTTKDYKFDELITACRVILSFGLKPYLKLGSVPLKLTNKASIDKQFNVNCCPPDDYNVYYLYIYDTITALSREFGLDETKTWRYSVMTEYENVEWFYTSDKDPGSSMRAYFELYDTTVAALQEVLGNAVNVGAHAMAMGGEGNPNRLWDPVLLLEHCAVGTNYRTGKNGTRICFLTISSYEWPMCKGDVQNLGDMIAPFKEAAEKYNLNLNYGIDESRIGIGLSFGNMPGSLRKHPANHITGHAFQAAYDAQLIKQMVDNDIDYCSTWGYTSAHGISSRADAPECYPTVSFHIANEYMRMCSGKRLPVQIQQSGSLKSHDTGCQVKVDALAAIDDEYIHIMIYNFGNSINYETSVDIEAKINVSELSSARYEVTKSLIGDEANYFPEWLSDRKKHGIEDARFLRSPDSAALDSHNVLAPGWARDLYFNELRPKYVELSKLKPASFNVESKSGKLIIPFTLPANNVVFLKVRK